MLSHTNNANLGISAYQNPMRPEPARRAQPPRPGSWSQRSALPPEVPRVAGPALTVPANNGECGPAELARASTLTTATEATKSVDGCRRGRGIARGQRTLTNPDAWLIARPATR